MTTQMLGPLHFLNDNQASMILLEMGHMGRKTLYLWTFEGSYWMTDSLTTKPNPFAQCIRRVHNGYLQDLTSMEWFMDESRT